MLLKIFDRFVIAGLIACFQFSVAGCSNNGAEPQHGEENNASPTHTGDRPHETHSHESHSEHHGDAPSSTVRRLVVKTEPDSPSPGSPTKLEIQILDEVGAPVRNFEVIHEKLVHLIVVRDGLDEFAHLHPEVNSSGHITQEYTFPKAGKYRLFADHQPKGQSPGVAVAEVDVGNEANPAETLTPNAPGEIEIGEVKVRVEIERGKEETRVRFTLVDAAGVPIVDLQPYLGAMGHLVVISADGGEYVHAHPVNEGGSAPGGIVEFLAHYPKPGIYKAWGQFQRGGTVVTVPFVTNHQFASHEEHQ